MLPILHTRTWWLHLISHARLVAVSVCLLLSVVGASAQSKYYLPQVVDGSYGPGSYQTTFVFFNNTDTSTTAVMDLTDDAGKPLTMTIGKQTDSRFVVQLAAGASQVLQSSGRGSLVSGAATVISPTPIGVSAVFGLCDASGNTQAETGIGSVDPLSSLVLPVDTTRSFNTGVALFNVTGGSVTVTLTLRDTGGLQVESPATLALSADQKVKLAALRKSIMSGTYADGTPFDFSACMTPFLYSSVISDTTLLAPYLNNTDYLFFEP